MKRGIGSLLAERARVSRETEGVVDLASGTRLTFGDLDRQSSRIAAVLADRVKPGDRIALLAGNSHRYAEVLFAAAKLGAILVPFNWRLTAPELAYQLDDCDPAIAIHDDANADAARLLADGGASVEWLSLHALAGEASALGNAVAPRRDISPDDGFLILYTSGTTGRPKGALHTHGSSLAWCASTIASFENRFGDRQLLVAPLFHTAGICVLLNAVHRDLGPGERGDLVTRGPHVFREYWRQPDETRRAFQDGWFRLGDIGETDADGFITICDRSKDMIISGGENVYPAELENVLMRNPHVLEVAVVGRPDDRWGEVPVATVVLRDAAVPDSVRAELRLLASTELARFKQPADYLFVPALPRNAAGKVQKHLIRQSLS